MQKIITISSSKRLEMIDINDQVEHIVSQSKIKEGICNVFTTHATAAIVINENYDKNVCEDFNEALSRLIPKGKWKHDVVDGNADAHIKSAIIGPSQTIPIKNSRLQLGQWQSIMFVELDGPRAERNIIITIIGE